MFIESANFKSIKGYIYGAPVVQLLLTNLRNLLEKAPFKDQIVWKLCLILFWVEANGQFSIAYRALFSPGWTWRMRWCSSWLSPTLTFSSNPCLTPCKAHRTELVANGTDTKYIVIRNRTFKFCSKFILHNILIFVYQILHSSKLFSFPFWYSVSEWQTLCSARTTPSAWFHVCHLTSRQTSTRQVIPLKFKWFRVIHAEIIAFSRKPSKKKITSTNRCVCFQIDSSSICILKG